MLHPSVTREWVGEGELPRERTKNRDDGGPMMCWQRPHMEILGETSVESLIACSHGGRALVIKGAEEVETTDANSKYQDRAKGQRPRNFIRPVSTSFLSR
ncbi:hypothetical protein BHE74_00053618 [Ensete ventricosum]|nr:hypothetical protein BHE74_00053618 [Ensete ventricosum]